MKILITSYYELKEALLSASKALSNLNIDIINYPLLQKKMELHNYVDDFNKFIEENKPDVILWWYISIDVKDFEYIINNNKEVKNIFFNWDEPYNWKLNSLEERAKLFDHVFVCCKETLQDYIDLGTGGATCLYPGFDPKIHYPIVDQREHDIEKFSCDISVCFTNLYDDPELYPDQYINRKLLIDAIYDNQKKYNYTFHIYGTDHLREKYPDSYKGFLSYEDTNKLFNYSKINLCTHVLCNKTGYLNERVMLILAAGGLLLVDPVKGIEDELDIDKECILINKEGYLEQIVEILENYEKYYITRYYASEKSKEYSWGVWANKINDDFITHLSD